MKNITSYRSGAGSISDLKGYIFSGVPVGLTCSRLSDGQFAYIPPNIEKEIIGYSYQQKVFIDSGAFSVFQKSLKVGFPIVLDFDAIMKKYLFYATFGHFALVMPDCIGDQEKTFELQFAYRKEIRQLVDLGADVIVPIQKGEMSPSECWKIVSRFLSEDIRIAIPSNKEAFSYADIEDLLLSDDAPTKIHLLGFTHASRSFTQKIGKILDLSKDIDITCDGNRLRAMLGEGRKVTDSQRSLTCELQDTITRNSCTDDDTIADNWQTIHHLLGNKLTEKQALQIAEALSMYEFDNEELVLSATNGDLMEWMEENLPGFGEYPEDALFKLVFSWESRDEISILANNKAFSDSIDAFFPESFNFCPVPDGVARMLAVAKHADEKIPHVPVQQSIMSWFKLAA